VRTRTRKTRRPLKAVASKQGGKSVLVAIVMVVGTCLLGAAIAAWAIL